MAHGVVRTDNMLGTVSGAYLASVKYLPSNTPTAIDNGNFVVVGDLMEGEREVHAASTPAADSAFDSLALIASEEVDSSKKYNAPADFQNAAGAICRGYRLHKHDCFSLTADCFTTAITPTPGTSLLEAVASTKAALVNSLTASSTQIAKLIAIETQGATTWYVFEC